MSVNKIKQGIRGEESVSRTKEYTKEEMLETLVNYFEENSYDVTKYPKEYSPTRVPLYCKKEGKIKWDETPGEGDKHLRKFLKKYFDSKWVNKAKISKIKKGKIIKLSYDGKSVEISRSEGKLLIKTDEKTYDLMVDEGDYYLTVYEDIVVEFTTAREISKKEFFPELPIGKGMKIIDASAVSFYQYYFPKAKICYAIPDYVDKNDEFQKFRNVCIKRGIGLLEVSKKGIEEMETSRSLFDEIYDKLIDNTKNKEEFRKIIGEYLENFLQYLVEYPHAIFTRSTITESKPGKISRYLIINKLQNLKNIQYASELITQASTYLDASKDDSDLVLSYIIKLWGDRLGLEYPDIQRHLEEILLRDIMYRDHFVHQFQVFLIGACILDEMYKLKNFKGILQSFEDDYKCKIEDAWLAASTYHDFNYGLQNFDVWLLQFFSDTLSINNEEARENLNTLNLDAIMVRESLSDIIKKMVNALELNKNTENKAIMFFYEKAVRDRNHGVLSALSILKLCEIQKDNLKIDPDAMLQVALSIACHDEDVWEAMGGCKGYRSNPDKCEDVKKCHRDLYPSKAVAIYRRNIPENDSVVKCECWEKELMDKSVFKNITFKDNPILFLLIFCDTIQEEGRITSMDYSDNNSWDKLKFEIEIDNSNFIKWYEAEKKFEEFKKTNSIEADKIKSVFTIKDHVIPGAARIYKDINKKWKIVDKKIVYELVRKIGNNFNVTQRETECSLNKIDVGSKSVEIDLSIDGFKEKVEELTRVSWVLKDACFKVRLHEKNTEKIQKNMKTLIIDGSGGG